MTLNEAFTSIMHFACGSIQTLRSCGWSRTVGAAFVARPGSYLFGHDVGGAAGVGGAGVELLGRHDVGGAAGVGEAGVVLLEHVVAGVLASPSESPHVVGEAAGVGGGTGVGGAAGVGGAGVGVVLLGHVVSA